MNLVTHEEFYVEQGLYNPLALDNKIKDQVYDLVFTEASIDCHCIDCDNNSIFKPLTNRPRTSLSTGLGMGTRIVTADEWSIDFNTDSLLINKQFTCSRNRNHHLTFNLLIKDQQLQKIGQYPSIRDLNISLIKKFRNVLKENHFREYSTAIGLHSHGIGIGSFVYLRRIIENFIIRPAHERAKKSDNWNEKLFQKQRMKERISMLNNFIPSYLVQNKVIYSVISKGIHELSEGECNKHFPVVSSILNYVLVEIKENQETEKHKIEMTKKLSELGRNES